MRAGGGGPKLRTRHKTAIASLRAALVLAPPKISAGLLTTIARGTPPVPPPVHPPSTLGSRDSSAGSDVDNCEGEGDIVPAAVPAVVPAVVLEGAELLYSPPPLSPGAGSESGAGT
jgi:hypothetical protein